MANDKSAKQRLKEVLSRAGLVLFFVGWLLMGIIGLLLMMILIPADILLYVLFGGYYNPGFFLFEKYLALTD